MNKKKIIFGILIAAWLCFIWGHSLQPADISDGESGIFLEFFSKFIPALNNAEDGMYIIRKLAHFTEYTVLGAILTGNAILYVRGFFNRFLHPAFTGLAVSFIDETIQLFVEGRSGQVSDMWIDFAGVCLGTLIILAFINNKGRATGRNY